MIQGNKKNLIHALSRKLNWAVWMNHCLPGFFALAGFSATLLLLLKMLLPQLAGYSFYCWAAFPFLLVHSYARCRSKGRFYAPRETAEVIDHLYRNDGSVTSFFERPDLAPGPQFFDDLSRNFSRRAPRLEPGYYARRLTLPLLYLAAALLIPPRPSKASLQNQEVLSALAQPLFEKLEANKDLLAEDERNDLSKDLDEMMKDNQGVSKEQWEAVEEIEQRIENSVKQNQAGIQQVYASLNQVSGILNNSNKDSDTIGLDADQQASLENLAQNLELSSNLGKLPLTAQQREQMRQMVKGMKSGQCKSADFQKCLSQLQGELAGLCQGQGEGPSPDVENGKPGRGGINRGRGDAPMVYGDEKNLAAPKFSEKELHNDYLTAEDIVDLGILPVEPKVDPGQFSPGTLKEYAPLEGTQVSRTQIAPSRKDVVSRYFKK